MLAHLSSYLPSSGTRRPQANASTPPAAPGTPPGVTSASSSSNNSTPDANYGTLDDDASLLLQMETTLTRPPQLGDGADVLSPIAQTTLGESMDATGATTNLLGEHGGSAFFPNTTAP